MSWILLAALLAQPTAGLQNLDTPLADPVNNVVELTKGDVVPFDATCLDKPQALNVAKEVATLRAENKEMKQSYVRPLLIAGLVVAGLAAGIAAGYGISQATRK